MNEIKKEIKEIKLDLLIDFYKREGRLPKGNEFIEIETYKFKIGIYLRNLKQGNLKLSENQREKLDQEIPHWDVVNKHYDKDEKINMLIAFYKLEGRLPKNDEVIGNDEYEFDGGAFVQNLKQKRITLSDQQREKLDQEIPDWDVIKHKSKRIHV